MRTNHTFPQSTDTPEKWGLKEWQDLHAAVRNGDIPLATALEIAVDKTGPIRGSIINGYRRTNPGLDFEEIEQAVVVSILIAADKYFTDTEENTAEFTTYAYNAIRGKVLLEVERATAEQHELFESSLLVETQTARTTTEEFAATRNAAWLVEELLRQANLTDIELACLEGFAAKETLTEIAARIDVYPSSVMRATDRVKAKILAVAGEVDWI